MEISLHRCPWVLMHEAPRGQEGFELTARREGEQNRLGKCLGEGAAELCSVLCCRRAFQQFYKEYVEYTCPTEDIYLE